MARTFIAWIDKQPGGDRLAGPVDAEYCYKTQIEARDKRIAIEDACEQVLGRRLTLWASISGNVSTAGGGERGSTDAASGSERGSIGAASGSERGETERAQRKEKGAAEDDPKLRALVDKFHGEVIEVIKPEQ